MRLPETNRNNMRLLFAPIICILLFWCCSNSHNPNVVADEQHNAKFDSFLAQFAQFDSKQLSEAFFRVREQFSNEKFSKFGRQETSDISLKYSQLSNFKTFIFPNFCIYKKEIINE